MEQYEEPSRDYLQLLALLERGVKKLSSKLSPQSFLFSINQSQIEAYKEQSYDIYEPCENHLYFSYDVFGEEKEISFTFSVDKSGFNFDLASVAILGAQFTPELLKNYKDLAHQVLQTLEMFLSGQIFIIASLKDTRLAAVEIVYEHAGKYTVLETIANYPLFGDTNNAVVKRNKEHISDKQLTLPKNYFAYDTTKGIPFTGRDIVSINPSPLPKKHARSINLKRLYNNSLEIDEETTVTGSLLLRWQTWVLAAIIGIVVLLVPDGWGPSAGLALCMFFYLVLLPFLLSGPRSKFDLFIDEKFRKFSSSTFDWTSKIMLFEIALFFVKDMTLTTGKEVSMFNLLSYTKLVYFPFAFAIILTFTTLKVPKTQLNSLKLILWIAMLISYTLAQELPSSFSINIDATPHTILSFIGNSAGPILFFILPIVYIYRIWVYSRPSQWKLQ